MMKIVLYMPQVSYESGGDRIHVRELRENLSKFLDIIAIDMGVSFNIPVFTGLFSILKSSTILIKKIISENPDLIYTRGENSFFAVIIGKVFGVRVVVEVNGLLSEEMKLINSITGYILHRLNERSYRYADAIVAVTQKIKEEIMRTYNIPDDKITVIENGANTDVFRPIDEKEAKKELNLDYNSKYVCFVGSLFKWQGVEYLIRSVPLILKSCPNTKFLVVGDGMMRKELEELADNLRVSGNVIFTGSVPYEKVPLYISASDVCVVYKRPLKSGYSPLKLYEYMACGKAVVASRVDGFEVLEKIGGGALVEPENPEKLAETIVRLLKDKKLQLEMGKNGRKYVVENHSWEVVARKVAEVCEIVARGK